MGQLRCEVRCEIKGIYWGAGLSARWCRKESVDSAADHGDGLGVAQAQRDVRGGEHRIELKYRQVRLQFGDFSGFDGMP